MKTFSIEPPYLIFLSLIDVNVLTILGGDNGNSIEGEFSRDNIFLPPFVFDNADLTNGQIHEKIKPFQNFIWQAAIKRSHDLEKPIRFWASPDFKDAWEQFIQLKVDFINTDKINELSDYMVSRNK